jgi:hypothetical protein
MNESERSALRNAAERINAERSAWDGVGFMAIENLETGACGLVLVPKGTPRPNWSKELQDASPAWERYEDQQLAQWLPRRWGADLTTDDRFPELMNLLKLHLPAALVAKLPAPSRRLACGRGFAVHTVPPAALTDDLLARLVAWLSPWQPMVVDTDGRYACNWWDGIPAGTSRMWHPCSCVFGAAGRTNVERIAATGAIQWGLITGWSSVIDAVVAYLLATADTLDAAPRVPAGDAPTEERTRISGALIRLTKARRHVVLVAVHGVVTRTSNKNQPTAERQRAAHEWACDNKGKDVRYELASAHAVWCPAWYSELLRSESPPGSPITVESLLDGETDAGRFVGNVRTGMTAAHRKEK